MPLKIVATPNDLHRSRKVIYLPDAVDRQIVPRPQGRIFRDEFGRLTARPAREPNARQLFVGLDLGQSNDFTAVVVVERTATGLVVPLISRVRGLPYTTIVTNVADLMARPELRGARLVIDATGVGRPVLDLLRSAGLDPLAVTITAGTRVTGGRRRVGVPKRDLINAVLLALQSETLKFNGGLDHADELRAELADMRAKITAAGNDRYEARDGAHDDLVLALALAVWAATRTGPRAR